MANDISTRQWRLDSPRPFGQPGAVIWDSIVAIRNVEFSGYSAQASRCVLKDRTGRIVWAATGSTTLGPIRMGEIGWANGLVLDQLDDGICVVYIR